MTLQWYALRSKTHKEPVLFKQVVSHKIECFYPRVKVNPVNPRAAKTRPYFPNYMFVHVDLDEIGLSAFRWMPFSQGLVSFGGVPASVADSLINALRKREISSKGSLRFDALEAGTPVRVVEGLFRGYEGLFDRCLAGEERVRVLLQLLNDRQMPVELRAGQIVAKNRP